MRGLSGTSSSNTQRVAIAACAADSGNVIFERLRRRTMPPVSVNQIWPLACLIIVCVPLVRNPVGVDVAVPQQRGTSRGPRRFWKASIQLAMLGMSNISAAKMVHFGAPALHRAVVGRHELGPVAGRLAAVVGLVPGGEVGDPRVAGAELAEGANF